MIEQIQEPAEIQAARAAIKINQQRFSDVRDALSRHQEQRASAEHNLETAKNNLARILATKETGWPDDTPASEAEERGKLRQAHEWLADLELIEPVLEKWLVRYENRSGRSPEHIQISGWEYIQRASQP